MGFQSGRQRRASFRRAEEPRVTQDGPIALSIGPAGTLGSDGSTLQSCLPAWALGWRRWEPDPCGTRWGGKGSYSLRTADEGFWRRPDRGRQGDLRDMDGGDQGEEKSAGPAETRGSPCELHSDT